MILIFQSLIQLFHQIYKLRRKTVHPDYVSPLKTLLSKIQYQEKLGRTKICLSHKEGSSETPGQLSWNNDYFTYFFYSVTGKYVSFDIRDIKSITFKDKEIHIILNV